MAYIIINSIDITPTPISNVQASVWYKLSTEPDGSYIVYTASATVLPNGDFSPLIYIDGLIDGEEYTVRIAMNCGGDPFIFTTTATSAVTSTTTSTTTIAPLTAYWGFKDDNSVLSQSAIVASPLNGTFTDGATIIANYTSNAVPKYLWMAELSTQPIKTNWYGSVLNNGSIGGPSDLFGTPVISGSYRFYITQYQTQNTDTPIEFRPAEA